MTGPRPPEKEWGRVGTPSLEKALKSPAV